MTHPGPVEAITHEREFKLLCDGLLPFEFGPLVQTFAGAGRDEGVDAEFTGTIAGVTGRWVFQYKFTAPAGGLRERRASVERCFTGKESEFDKPGVEGCAGYVLLTNVPSTQGMVKRLKSAWTAAPGRMNRPLVVWDVGALNARLKGREHLARSWSGAKEARCRQTIIEPLWRWTCSAMRTASDWPGFPLWPLTMVSIESRRLTSTFNAGFEWEYGMQLVCLSGEVNAAVADPLYRYSAGVAYPRALETVPRLVTAIGRLEAALRAQLDLVLPEVRRELPALSRIANEAQRTKVESCLSFCLLELGWGVPSRALHSVSKEGRFLFAAQTVVHEGDELRELGPELDRIVAQRRQIPIPSSVLRAREHLEVVLYELWRRLWYVVELGIDADLVELAAADEATP